MLKNSAVETSHAKVASSGDANSSFVFRPIHYLGSKLRILSAIEDSINEVDPSGGPVCDLFSGSATVARYLSRRRRVMAVDIQEYARVLAEAVLTGGAAWSVVSVEQALAEAGRIAALNQAISPLAKLETKVALGAASGNIDPLCELLELGNLASLQEKSLDRRSSLNKAVNDSLENLAALELPAASTVCIRHFGGQYFSYAQAAELDALADMARSSNNPVLLAAVLSTASHLVNSIGKQFAQPIKPRSKLGVPKAHVVNKIIKERELSAFAVFMSYLERYEKLPATRSDHVAVRADFKEALANPVFKPSVVYADPPYTRDHYSRFYHSLETIALGDDPSITKSNIGGGSLQSRGGYRSGRHQSPFCIKSAAPSAFASLFAGVATLGVPLVLSYSGYDPSMEARPRVMSLDNIIASARQHFKRVEVKTLDSIDHIKLNNVALNKAAKGTNEVILMCT